jgi:hypothetical protein
MLEHFLFCNCDVSMNTNNDPWNKVTAIIVVIQDNYTTKATGIKVDQNN